MAVDVRRWTMVPNASVTENGTIFISLKQTIIELTIDGGIHITDLTNSTRLAMSRDGSATAMIHPKGCMFGFNTRVEIQVDHHKGIRYAKMWEKGISFTTDDRPVTFLIDAGGIKTTVDWFLTLDSEFINKAFYFNSVYGPQFIEHATYIINKANYWVTEWGQRNWKIGHIRISETVEGYIRVYTLNSGYQLRINFGSLLIQTPLLHCTASLGANGHMFVRRGNSRMHYDGQLFIIRNEGQSAGIDQYNNFNIY